MSSYKEEDISSLLLGSFIVLIVLYVAYLSVSSAIDEYGYRRILLVCGIVTIITITTSVSNKTWKEANSLTQEGKVLIKFGFIWSISIFMISAIADELFVLQYDGNRGAILFLASLLINMPGTCALLYSGVKCMKSCNVEDRRREGKKIQLFGVFWFFFWIILPLPHVITYSILPLQSTLSTFLLIAIPGSVVIITIGIWSSHINVKQGWEDLSDAQKALGMERSQFEEQEKYLSIERERLNQQKEELSIKREELIRKKEELIRQNDETQQQQKELKKQHKGLQKIKDDTTGKIKDMEVQQIEIKKAREELEKTWNELEDAVKKNPFKLFIKEKLTKDIFVQEIEELKMAKPGDVLFINTEADKVVLNIREELKKEIANMEDGYYYEAFLEHFKNTNGDKIEYDRIRVKYNPTIHVQADRRNKEWAERRRFDLSKIEKLSIRDKKVDD